MSFRIFSNDLRDGGILADAHVLNQFGFNGKNVSPHLAWEGEPSGTKSFVVTVYDPDAPTGSGWWHWIVVEIPDEVHELAAGAGSGSGSVPRGALQTRTDFGAAGYGGAAPPPGAPHRYIFTVHALSVDKLGVDAESSGAMVGFLMSKHTLGKAALTVTFQA
jgi:Raf kinase inhibitor-like YbhB/YbcL family protein